MPVWVFGALWLVLGSARTLAGRERAGVLDAVIVGLAVLIIAGVAIARAAPAASSAPGEADDWECSRCGHKNPGRVRVCKSCGLQT